MQCSAVHRSVVHCIAVHRSVVHCSAVHRCVVHSHLRLPNYPCPSVITDQRKVFTVLTVYSVQYALSLYSAHCTVQCSVQDTLSLYTALYRLHEIAQCTLHSVECNVWPCPKWSPLPPVLSMINSQSGSFQILSGGLMLDTVLITHYSLLSNHNLNLNTLYSSFDTQ